MRIITYVIILAVVAQSGFVLAQPTNAQDKPEQTAQTSVPQPDNFARGAFGMLLAALETGDYQSAVMPMNEQMKTTFTKRLFERLSAKYSPRLKQGYESIYLGVLKKKGLSVHLWKLAFEDKGDDVLAELSIKDNKVDGFYMRS